MNALRGWVLVADDVDHEKAGRVGHVLGSCPRLIELSSRDVLLFAVKFPDGTESDFFEDELSKWVVA